MVNGSSIPSKARKILGTRYLRGKNIVEVGGGELGGGELV